MGAHTPFFKVVARTRAGGYLSVYDGRTRYVFGVESKCNGCFVHASAKAAARSITAFPRSSKAWDAPRALLLVRGEGDFCLRHGKIFFDGITPLDEVQWTDVKQDL